MCDSLKGGGLFSVYLKVSTYPGDSMTDRYLRFNKNQKIITNCLLNLFSSFQVCTCVASLPTLADEGGGGIGGQ